MLHVFRRRLKAAYWDSTGPDYDFNRDAYDPESDGFASHWALTWLHRAASSGDAFSTEATFLIGNIYQRRKDFSRAVEWYRNARDWDGFSLIGLGTLYMAGQGVDQNFTGAPFIHESPRKLDGGTRRGDR